MKAKQAIFSTIASVALVITIALPALAGPPTFSGPISCASNAEATDMGTFTEVTKREIAVFKRYWTSRNVAFCEKGSVDTSRLVKDV